MPIVLRVSPNRYFTPTVTNNPLSFSSHASMGKYVLSINVGVRARLKFLERTASVPLAFGSGDLRTGTPLAP